MAFPTTPILDDFNTTGLQAVTARAGWGAVAFGGGAYTTYTTDATPTLATHSAVTGGNYWNSSSADCEAYCTVAAFNNVSDTMRIAARITVPGSSFTFYCVEADFSTTTDFQIVKYIAGARTALGTNPSTTVVANDGMGISVIGTSITSYYRSGLAGAWVAKETVTDSSITGSGFIGGFQHIFAVANSIGEFGGGAPSGDVARPLQRLPFTRGAGGGGKI